jgi:hypothetical protein
VVFTSLRNVQGRGVCAADAFTLPTVNPSALGQPWGLDLHTPMGRVAALLHGTASILPT